MTVRASMNIMNQPQDEFTGRRAVAEGGRNRHGLRQ